MRTTKKMRGFNRLFLFGILLLVLSGNSAAVEDTRIMVPSPDVYGPQLPIRRIAGPQWAAGMELRGNLLYVLGAHALWIYDVTDPLQPRPIGKCDGLFNGRQIALSGSTACIAARANGLYLVDISDPRHPRQLSRFDTIELATGVAAAGPVAFVSLRVYGIECVDISDPAQPRHLSLTKTPEAQSSWYDAGKLYVGNWAPCSMSILDLANPCAPELLCNHPLSGYGDGLMAAGSLGLASTGHHARIGSPEKRKNNGHGFDLIDLANPLHPKTLSHFHFPPYFSRGNDFWTVRLSGNIVIAADSHNGVFLVDISDRRNPKGVAHLRLPEVPSSAGGVRPDAVSGIAPGNNVVYLSGVRTGLFLAEIPGIQPMNTPDTPPPVIPPAVSSSSVPGFFCYDAGGQVRAAAVRGDIAWIAASHAGIHAVRLTDDGIKPLAVHPVPEAYDCKVSDDRLYVAEGANGLAVYQILPEGKLALLGRSQKLPSGELAQLVWVIQGTPYAVVSARTGTLRFFDVSDPARIAQVFTHRQISLLYGDLLCDRLLGGKYIANNWHSGGLAWYDLSGSRPAVANRVVERLNGHLDGLTALNDKLLMLNQGRYALLSPNQPGPSKTWKRYSAGEPLRGIPSVDGTTVAISHRSTGKVGVYDFSNPEAARPVRKRSWKFDVPPGTVSFWRGRLVIPLSYRGLLLEQ